MTTTRATQASTAQVYQIFIKASPDAIWEAITKPEFSARYFYGSRVETTGEPGTPFRYHSPDGTSLWGDETVLESDPPRRLVVTWRSLYDPRLADEPASRVTWQIEPQDGGICLLTVVHDRLEDAPRTAENVSGPGWMLVLSGLKTILETGSGLRDS
ncbi:SRPBCC family protein [Actinotalea sp. M2MS4P-6]|uniref:SRPBCC family protein n=1 Tax=Actinotalea sp. M2MS4P-6 TaxID=2983762 RepID=UPI0021E460BE|nr:SRPBCC family protein [Actinotalea sp. M2MS4P-6]MCV2395319.1 SRPBCC family protein [Actinotalea sp. M2MS4P-6]